MSASKMGIRFLLVFHREEYSYENRGDGVDFVSRFCRDSNEDGIGIRLRSM